MPQISNGFMADIDAGFVQQILDIAKGQRETDLHHHRQADNLATGFEIEKCIRFGQVEMLQIRPGRLKLVLSDNTFWFIARPQCGNLQIFMQVLAQVFCSKPHH